MLSSIYYTVSMLFYNDKEYNLLVFYPLECSSNNRDFKCPFSRVNLHMLIERACHNLLICDAHCETHIYVSILHFGIKCFTYIEYGLICGCGCKP